MRSSLVLWMAGAPALAWFVFVGQMFGQTIIPERRYHVIDLGAFSGGASLAHGINNRGQVIGESVVDDFGPANIKRAFLYSNGSMRSLDTTPNFITHHYARGISDSGKVVGYSQRTDFQAHRALLYSNGSVEDLGTLGGLYSAASAINNQGQIVGWAYNSDGKQRAFMYSDDVMREIGLPGEFSGALALNMYGQVVGWFRTSNVVHAFLSSNGVVQDMGTLGGVAQYGVGINDKGHIITQVYPGNGRSSSFLYSNGSTQNLGTLGAPLTLAYGINNHNEIVDASSPGIGMTVRAFVHSNGVMKDLSDLLIDQNSGWTLTEATAINDSGQIVGSGINPSGQNHAFLLNPIDVNWIPTVTNTPVTPTYTPLPAKVAGKANLIVVTHGAIPSGESPTNSTAWVGRMTNQIVQYLTAHNLTNWQVVGYKWEEKAQYNILNPVGSQLALNRAWDEGRILGDCIAVQGWSHVHLIAHSAGAGLIQGITDVINSNPTNTTTIHSTFLDPFLGFGKGGKSDYGVGADWSDHYFTRDSVPLTEGIIQHAYNLDVTQLDTHRVEVDGWVSAATGEPLLCTKIESSHRWPIEFYENSFSLNEYTNYNGFGFPLSKEGGGWNYALAHYEQGSLTNLGGPDLECSLPPTDEPVYINLVNLAQNTKVISETGEISVSTNGFVGSSGSPAWIAVFLTLTNEVNFVSFDAKFLSSMGSQGLLTVYWDTNVIGTIDEQVVKSETRHYSFPFSRTSGSLSHMLGFRVDPFTSTQTSVLVTNVTTGLFGPVQPFGITQTTNTSNGFRIWELTGEPGFEYIVEVTTNLVDWQSIAVLLNTNGAVRFVDPSSTNSHRRFYRAVVP